MKLVQHTNLKLTVLLLTLIAIWGVFFYWAINRRFIKETDDLLRNYRYIFVKKALNEPKLLDSSYEGIFDRYRISSLTKEEAENYTSHFENSQMYFPVNDEEIPVRIYRSAFLATDSVYYELEISVSTIERDDMLGTLLYLLAGLYILLILCIIASNSIILRKSFKPLDKLLKWINSVTPGKPIPPLNNETSIVEFSQLNESVYDMAQRNMRVYEQQKQFIENASHELQTPLAVVLNKLEMIVESEALTEKQLEEVGKIYETLSKAVRLNKSILLLSKIENRQFADEKPVLLNDIIRVCGEDLTEVYQFKNIHFSILDNAQLNISMNDILAVMLVSNLLKNAFIYTSAGGKITISIEKDKVSFMNTGDIPLNAEQLFRRYYHTSESSSFSTGLGLAIVKSICELYNIDFSYQFKSGHIFLLKFPKKKK